MQRGRSRQQRRAIRQADIAKQSAGWGPAARGARMFRYGASPMNCPHVLGTTLWQQWMAGWRAQYDRRFGDGR